MLIALSGLPGVGKTSIARELARATSGVHLRIDSIEQPLRAAGWSVQGEGYAVAYSIAEDNLRLGRMVIADCVNPLPLTRDEWRAVASRAGVRVVDVEIVCSDLDEHRRRVESRGAPPTWLDVTQRDYRPWADAPIRIDTATRTTDESVRAIIAACNHNAFRQKAAGIRRMCGLCAHWCQRGAHSSSPAVPRTNKAPHESVFSAPRARVSRDPRRLRRQHPERHVHRRRLDG